MVSPKSDASRVYTYERRRKAVEMRLAGATFDEINAELQFGGRGNAHRAVRALMEEQRDLAYASADLFRQESLLRLEKLLASVWPMALEGSDKHVTQARLIISQIGDLRGEKAPIEVQIGESDVDRLLREALEELNRRSPATGGEAGDVQELAAEDR